MIRLTESRAAVRRAARAEPVMGAVLETLFAAYAPFPGVVDFYKTEGGALCRHGSELTLAGRGCDTEELCAFARATAAGRLTGLAASFAGGTPAGVAAERRCVMRWPHRACPEPRHTPSAAPAVDRVFELVRAGSAPHFDRADREAFIADVAYRRRLGLAKVFTVADAATAGVYATGATHALIACVATLPERRGRGYATALVRACVRHCLEAGRIPALVAENAELVAWYARLGFEPCGEALTFIACDALR